MPHFTSVINWTLRLGLGLLKQVKPINRPWLAIMDHSIDIGTKKAFVVLRVPIDILSNKKKAIQLKDCECIGLKISEALNGEVVSKDLKEIFDQSGIPEAIIKDGDATLNKGVKLWAERKSIRMPLIEDIGHVIATTLKSQYVDSVQYKTFTEITTKGANRLRQTEFAFLTPPKLRTKGRFQNISKLGKWGEKMLTVFAVKGAAKKGSLLSKIRSAFPGFSRLKNFIQSFSETAKVTSKIMEILKNKGLSQCTYEECIELSKHLPNRSKVKNRLLIWLQEHIDTQKYITSSSLLVSSDIIESLFGNYKHVIERSAQADINRTALLIPALCGTIDEITINNAFNNAKTEDINKWEEENIPYTVQKKRSEFLGRVKIQKVGK